MSIPHIFFPNATGKRGTYRFVRKGGEFVLQCFCPTCGHVTIIPINLIDKEGNSRQKISCDYGCGYEDHVLLKAWSTEFLHKDHKITKKTC